MSPFQSAKKEAFEEAGVKGSNTTKILGHYTVKKNGSELLTKIYSMKVTRIFKDYPEKNLRKRKWFSVTQTQYGYKYTPDINANEYKKYYSRYSLESGQQ